MSNTVTFRPTSCTVAEIRAAAKRAGKTVNRFIDDAVEEYIVIKVLQSGDRLDIMKVCRAMIHERPR